MLIGAPYWTSYPEMVTLARAEPVPVAGSERRDFLLTPDDLDGAATAQDEGVDHLVSVEPDGGRVFEGRVGRNG